jgi:hypothetical protein
VTSTAPHHTRHLLTRIAAWLVTGGTLAYLMWRVPVGNVLHHIREASWWTVPVLASLILVNFVADVFATWKTFSWFVAPLRFLELLTLRGATYLWALVNYALGQGALIYFVRRSRGVPLVRGAAAALLIMGLNLLLLLLLASGGWLLGAQPPPEVRIAVQVAWAGLVVYALLIAWKPGFLASRPIFDVLFEAGLRGHLKGMAVRLPHVLVLIIYTYVSLRAFHIPVPFLQTMLCMPVVFLVAVLPISVAGLGVMQLTMKFFFARYALGDPAHQEAAVVASSLGSQGIALAVQIVISLLSLRSHMGQNLKDLSKEIEAAT